MHQKKESIIITISLVVVLFLYMAAIGYINFSRSPMDYCTDMYSDMSYAEQVWKNKTLFPEGWVFGNQLYAVATPVIASFFWALTANHTAAMGIASTLMAAGVLASLFWMLRSFCKSNIACLSGVLSFLVLTLLNDDPIWATNGWQLFFTMCSYYACYAITAFLGFGCYLRSDRHLHKMTAILIFSCVLSFGTGIQSLRQTLIMTLPLMFLEAMKIMIRIRKKETLFQQSSFVAAALSFSNLAGVIVSKFLVIQQETIFGSPTFTSPAKILSSAVSACQNVLFLIANSKLPLYVFCLMFFVYCYTAWFSTVREGNWKRVDCIILFTLSLAAVFAIDILTMMQIRCIYYFMLFPMLSVILTCCIESCSNRIRTVIALGVICISTVCCISQLPTVYRDNRQGPVNISDYLISRNISTIYSEWNVAEKLAIASDWQLCAGFWNYTDVPFESVQYLCNPEVFQEDAEHIAYIFSDEKAAEKGIQAAASRGVVLSLELYDPEWNIWVYTAPVNLME